MLKKALWCLALTAMLPAILPAATILLTFAGLQDRESIANYYDGGRGSIGSGPGPDDGIIFSRNAIALISADDGGTGNFDGAPSMPEILSLFSGAGATMNVPAGFGNHVSFYYSAVNMPGAISIYDGLNGTGNLLATLNLPVTPFEGPGCDQPFCPFVPVTLEFDNIARSILFAGGPSQIGFDNIELGSVSDATVPEPGTWALLAIGLLAIGLRSAGAFRCSSA